MSPGTVKPGRVANAMLCARPIPDSSIPPHQTGQPASTQASCMAIDEPNPPTRPGLMFTIRPESR